MDDASLRTFRFSTSTPVAPPIDRPAPSHRARGGAHRRRRARRSFPWTWLLVIVLVLGTFPFLVRASTDRGSQGGTSAGAAPVAADGFQDAPAFTTPIPESPVLDPKSPTWSAWLSGGDSLLGPARALLYAFGLPIYYADPTTPRVKVVVDNEPDWGTDDLSQQPVPIPVTAAASTGSDGKLAVVDTSAGKVYELWAARLVDGQWHAAWGGVFALSGNGSSPNPDYVPTAREGVPVPIAWPKPTSRGTGSGVSSYQGIVRLREMANGSIDHALVFATDRACGPANTGPYRFPATTTDGDDTSADCIPEGTRVQLDPSIDVDAIPHITPGEKVIARALQRYGAYVTDNGPDRMSFSFEAPKPGNENPYPSVGFKSDYYNMPHIPWSGLRVLENWQGR